MEGRAGRTKLDAAGDAAVEADGVAWLAQRFAEREVFAAGEKKRAAAVQQLRVANRQVQEAIKLIVVVRTTSDAAVLAIKDTPAASGPRLFGGAG